MPILCRTWAMVPITCLVLAACGDAVTTAPGAVPQWSLGEAVVVLGTREGGPAGFSPIGGIGLGPRSELHVLLPQEHEVRVFGGAGEYLGSVGAEGEGPGEFRRPSRIGFVGDTLWVLDDGARRVSLFHERILLRVESYPPMDGLHAERMARPIAVLAGPALLVITDGQLPFQPAVTGEPGLLFRYANGHFDTLGTMGVDHTGGYLIRGTPGAIEMMLPFPQPFSQVGLWGTANDGSMLTVVDRTGGEEALPAAYSVTSLSAAGDTVSATSHEYDPVPIPASVVDSLLTPYARGGFTVADVRDAAYLPDAYPPVSKVVIGAGGLVWLAREGLPGQRRAWQVISEQGKVVAELLAPAGFEISLVSGDEVWGLVTDELDVPYLVKRPISRE